MPKSLSTLFRTVPVLLLSAAVLCGCEEEVTLDFEMAKSTLVLSSSFFPNQPVVLQVSATRPRGSSPVQAISDATVLLYEGSELAEELTYVPPRESEAEGTYRTKAFKPQIGHQYTIHVSAPGYDPVSAVSSIPEPVAITNLQVQNLSQTIVDGEALIDYQLLIDYEDPVNQINYYDLRIHQMVVPFKINSHGDTLRSQPYIKSVSTPLFRNAEGRIISVLLQDKGGQSVVNVQLQCRIKPSSELLGEVVAELRTVSPEYYFYQRSISRPDEIPNSGLRDPVIFFNNVSSGMGVFAGYTSVQEGLSFTGN